MRLDNSSHGSIASRSSASRPSLPARTAIRSGRIAVARPMRSRSRGPARPEITRLISRSRSPMPVSFSASRVASDWLPTTAATASSRRSIWTLSTSGAESHSTSKRDPIGDFVRSTTPASVPSRRLEPPVADRTSSRLRREASSISMRWPGRQAESVSMRATAAGSFSSR